MQSQIADITLHIDQETSAEQREELLGAFQQREGVIQVLTNPKRNHLLIIKYNPELISSRDLVTIPSYLGMHAELAGL